MTEAIINEEALEHIAQKLDTFVWTDKDKEERDILRQHFQQTYNKQKIDNLTKEDYFAGLGRKQGCLAYDLEWGTKPLGSIKGGSKYKYGYETDFPKIKSLLQKIVSIDTKAIKNVNGVLAATLQNLCSLSKEINGFKTGRTVIPKLLSIYYPDTFLSIFNDQDHFLSKLLISGFDTENTGLELYFEYNFKLLKVKKSWKKLSARPLTTLNLYDCFIMLFQKNKKKRQ